MAGHQKRQQQPEPQVFELKKGDLQLKVTNWGATITSLQVPDASGKLADVVLGFDTLTPYMDGSSLYFGCIVGRVANRIENGGFTLNGQQYSLPINNGPNTLHGGKIGFNQVVWKVEEQKDGENPSIKFTYHSHDGEQGFPGDLDVSATYTLSRNLELRLDMEAIPRNKPTPVSLAQHTYWNFAMPRCCCEFSSSMAATSKPRVLGLATFSAEMSKSFTLLSSHHRASNIFNLKEGILRARNLKLSEGLSSIRPSGRKEVITIEAVVKRNPKRLKYTSPPFRKGEGVLYLKVDPSGVDAWRLEPVIELLKQGAVGVIPTDTVYAFVSDVKNQTAVERIHRVKGTDTKKPLSILCRFFQDIDTYTTGFPCGNSQGQANIFRAAHQCLPGPYTFILPASKELPKQCMKSGTSRAKHVSRKCVGVRMPNDAICQAILEKLDGPLLCSSVRTADDEWMIDPAVIAEIYGASTGQEGVDFIVDGGVRVADPSTVVDMTGSEPILLRKGKGATYDWMLPKEFKAT